MFRYLVVFLQVFIFATVLAATTSFAVDEEADTLDDVNFTAVNDVIRLEAGQSQIVTTDFNITKIATGNPAIARGVLVGEKEALINAQSAGTTNILLLGDNNEKLSYEVDVSSAEANMTQEELAGLFEKIPKVTVRKIGRKVLLEGEVLSVQNLDRINMIVKDMSNVVNLVRLSPMVKEITKQEILNAVKKEGGTGVTVKIIKDNFMLTGVVPDEATLNRIGVIASAFNPNIINALSIDGATRPEQFTTIEMQISLIEIEKNKLAEWGVHWNPLSTSEATGTLTDNSDDGSWQETTLTGTISDFFPKMQRVFENGKGRSLLEQSITAKSGEEANFFVGTEYPVTTTQDGGELSTEYKEIGVRMEMTPSLRTDNFINSPINIESTSITGTSTDGLPILSSSKLKTVMNLVDGTSVAIAGLIGRKETQGLTHSPPSENAVSLVQLNRGRNSENDTRQVLVVITPRIIDYYDKATKQIGGSIENEFKQIELKALRKAYEKQN